MAFYKSPFRPYDPVIEDAGAPSPSIQYLRDNFAGQGQDSFTKPPAQDQAQWQALTNIMPIRTATLQRRWGTLVKAIGITGGPYTRSYEYANDLTLQRRLLFTSASNILATSENIVAWNSNVFTPSPDAIIAPRVVDSRNFAYFLDGSTTDLNKWNGAASGGVTNWGINANDVTTTTSGGGTGPSNYGPFAPTAAAQSGTGTVWANPTNIEVQDGAVASATLTTDDTTLSEHLQGTAFGFAAAGQNITGIKVEVKADIVDNGKAFNKTLTCQLLKAGTRYANQKTMAINTGSLSFYTFGSSTDLWGGAWSNADVNSSTFGIDMQASISTAFAGASTTFNIDFVRITVYVQAGNNSSASSGNGVGIKNTSAGNVNLVIGRTYYLAPKNSITGHYGDLSLASNSSGPVTNLEMNLLLAVYNDPQVDYKVILATADGGDPSILYTVAEVVNSTTTYTDNTLESNLILSQQLVFVDQFQSTFGLALNTPPPNGTTAIKHRGRLYMGQQQNLFFSKSVAELTLPNGFIAGKYEESWPATNYFDVSEGAETIQGLMSDGSVLYIGTQRHIRRLLGDGPDNFQQPEIVHPEVGLLNQEVARIVYMEGTPTGFMWLTPDFRAMASNGNSFVDVGLPVQDILNSINPLAAQACHAMFVSSGPFDLYILAIPTGSNTFCDTHLIYDLRSQQWCVWLPPAQSATMIFDINQTGTPLWLFTDNNASSAIYQYSPTAVQDKVGGTPVNITSTATTSWLHFGVPTHRKVLDELMTTSQDGGNLSVSILGSTGDDQFVGSSVVSSVNPVAGPFGQFKVFLAGKTSKHKYYQMSFVSATQNQNILEAYDLRLTPWNTL